MKTAIVWTCAHADPKESNKRADLLGQLIYDVRPDYTVDLGDGANMDSLSSHDSRYPKRVVTRSYEKDILSYNDFQERLWWRFKHYHRKRPTRFGGEGNHEHRIKRAIDHDPGIEGTNYGVSFSHLNTDLWFDEYHEYQDGAPAIYSYDGIDYAHFVASGNFGQALSGDRHAYNLLAKRMNSATVGHSHKRNIAFRDDAKAIGLVAGCFRGPAAYAGQANQEWWSGVIIKRNIKDGLYDPEFVSMKRLEEVYG